MATTATLVYTVVPVPTVSLAVLKNAVQATLLPLTDLEGIGAFPSSDITTTVLGTVVRTIVFSLNATFNSLFPAGDLACPFRKNFLSVLGHSLASKVMVSEPVVI